MSPPVPERADAVGILLDPSPATPSRTFEVIFRMLAEGGATEAVGPTLTARR